MGLSDVIALMKPYGLLGVVLAMSVGAVVVLYTRLTKELDAAQTRGDRLEAEVRALNIEMNKQLLMMTRATASIGDAADTLRITR